MTQASEGLVDPRFLTISEVARILRVSKMTVYRMVHSGELPASQIGRTFRVPEQSVRELLKSAVLAGTPAGSGDGRRLSQSEETASE